MRWYLSIKQDWKLQFRNSIQDLPGANDIGNAIWLHTTCSLLVQSMACCLKQCWLNIHEPPARWALLWASLMASRKLFMYHILFVKQCNNCWNKSTTTTTSINEVGIYLMGISKEMLKILINKLCLKMTFKMIALGYIRCIVNSLTLYVLNFSEIT